MGAEQSSPSQGAHRPPPRAAAPGPGPRPAAPPIAKAPGGPPIPADVPEPSVHEHKDSPSAASEHKDEAKDDGRGRPPVVAEAVRAPAGSSLAASALPQAASSGATSPRDVELQPVPSVSAASARVAVRSAAPPPQAMPAIAQRPIVAAPAPAPSQQSSIKPAATVGEEKRPPGVVAVALPIPRPGPVPTPAPSAPSTAVQRTAASSSASSPLPPPGVTIVPVQPVGPLAHPLAVHEERKDERKEDAARPEAGPNLDAAIEPAGRPASEEKNSDAVQPQLERVGSRARREAGDAARAKKVQRSFLRFFLCGCGQEASDDAARPCSSNAAQPRPRAAGEPAEPPPPSLQPTPPQPPGGAAPAPSAQLPAATPPVAPVAVVNALPPNAVVVQVIGPPPTTAPVPGSAALLSPPNTSPLPAAASVEERKQQSLPAASPATAALLPPIEPERPDEPQQLMHPVYSHLPLLRVDPSSLSQYPPHRPPVPDPSEVRAFAAMRALPLPKSLQTPYLLTSLTDDFLPSSTSFLAFQSSTDWSYSLYLDILRACLQTGERFFDSQFPPSAESLFAHYEPRFPLTESNELYAEAGSYAVQETGTRWCRASEMSVPRPSLSSLFSSWELMHEVLRASDVRQGGLGTCYFVATVCSLVDRDAQFVRSLFLTPDYSPEGVYQIRLCRNSSWTVVTIDDFLPCLSTANSFRFTSAIDNQLWPALLEKAYAKLNASYKALESGLPHEVMADLTGCPAFEVSLHPHYDSAVGSAGGPGGGQQPGARSAPLQFVDRQGELDVLWLQLLEWRSRGYFFCATCGAPDVGGQSDREEEWRRRFAQVGLVTQHVYSLLDVAEEGGVRYVKLRNPWGRYVWRGRGAKGPSKEDAKAVAEREAAVRQQQQRALLEQHRQAQARAARPKTWKDVVKGAVKSVIDSVNALDEPYPAAASSSSASASSPPLPRPREDRGLFWMQWEDWTQYFSTLFVCQFGDRWQELRCADEFAAENPALSHHSATAVSPGQSMAAARSASAPYYSPAMPLSPSAVPLPSTLIAHSMFELLVSSPTCVFLTIVQPDKRGEPPGVAPQPTYQPLGLYLLQSTNETSSLSRGRFSFVPSHFQLLAYKRPYADRSVTAEVLLPSITSRYLLLPEALLYGVQSLPYVLTVHADRPFYCRRIPILPPALSYSRLLAPPAGNLHTSLMSHFHCRVQEMRPLVYLITYAIPGGAVYVVQNHDAKQHLHMSMDATNSVRVLGSRANGLVCYDVVPPMSEQLMLIVSGWRKSLPQEKPSEVRLQYTFQLRPEPTLQRFATRIAHHPLITGMDYHQPRRIVAERRL